MRVLNGRYHSGVEFLEWDTLASGVMVLQAVTGRSLAILIWDWLSRFLHLPWRGASTEEFLGPWLEIETKPRLDASVDGDVLTKTPAIVECASKAVEVVVPQ